jgi:DNA (cytosine-5)-methyltransferase 1
MQTFYEFFAGGGMARAGLGAGWDCRFANDFDLNKTATYSANWGAEHLKIEDVGKLAPADLPGRADLAWASFPCQDLSLAGDYIGLKGRRSGTFWPFWRLMEGLIREDRAPRLIVLENVCSTLNSDDGKDFATICAAFRDSDYLVGAIVVDAALFVPQSRPRLFVIGVRQDVELPADLTAPGPLAPWHTRTLKAAFEKVAPKAKRAWVWWNLPLPPERKFRFSDLVEKNPKSVPWFTSEETRRLLSRMSPINFAKVAKAQRSGRLMVGGVYMRTRNEDGRKVQRAEVRFDVSGCLRTPAGGSSRQVIIVVNGASVKARLISTRETARLMGLPDTYQLPVNYNDAYHLTGDGVVAPVVRHLAAHIFEPVLDAVQNRATAAG